MTIVSEPLLLSVDAGSQAIGVGRSIFYEMLLRNEIPSIKIGKRRLVSRRALEEYVTRRESEGAANQ